MTRRLIKVKAIADGENLKCAWEPDGAFGGINITASMSGLKKWSESIRDRLNEFVMDYVGGHIDFNAPTGRQNCKVHLKELAKFGNNLYKILTDDLDHSQSPTTMKAWLGKFGDDCQINFLVPDGIHIPWGLIYSDDPDGLDTGEEGEPRIEDYGNFWGIKHSASSVYSTLPPPSDPTNRIASDSFSLLPTLNKGVFDTAYDCLDAVEQGIVDGFWKQTCVPVYNGDELSVAWQRLSKGSGILYFYCHANETSLELSKTEVLTAEDLRIALDEVPGLTSVNLAFFNGCSTAIGPQRQREYGRSFMGILKHLNFRGYIGTEAKVPDVFALRFGFDFLLNFLHGDRSLSDTMSHLRVKHWPLSLVYTMHCDPLVEISRSTAPGHPDRLSDDNFSLGQVGSDTLGSALEAA
jgi:hypothetical protein